MTNDITTNGWLADEHPELYHLLHAEHGDAEALNWLQRKDPNLGLFARALSGDRAALDKVPALPALDLDDLFSPGGTALDWLSENHRELFMFFEVIKGDNEARRRLAHKRPLLVRLADAARGPYLNSQHFNEEPPTGTDGVEAADVGCLIGEMHLRDGDFARAVEAFTRAIETNPAADEYEGRARAYRALAFADERRALELRAAAGSTVQ
jgi:tetratricopeptide (TPR) repeat protein